MNRRSFFKRIAGALAAVPLIGKGVEAVAEPEVMEQFFTVDGVFTSGPADGVFFVPSEFTDTYKRITLSRALNLSMEDINKLTVEEMDLIIKEQSNGV